MVRQKKFKPIEVRPGAVKLLAKRFRCAEYRVDLILSRGLKTPLSDAIIEAAKEYAPIPPRVIKPIKVYKGAIGEIAERMGLEYRTVQCALYGRLKNELGDKIRKVGKEYIRKPNAARIKVRFGGEIELAKRFGCDVSLVREALKGSQISPLRIAIREAAKDYIDKPEQLPIKVKYGGLVRLAKEYGCSDETVRLALKGEIYSPLATKIRNKAYELGLVIEK